MSKHKTQIMEILYNENFLNSSVMGIPGLTVFLKQDNLDVI